MASLPAGIGGRAEIGDLLMRSKELKQRILFVLMVLVVYRLGTHVPLPGIDAVALTQFQGQLQQGLFGMFNMFSGGAFARMSVFALNIMPYITASIIIQLMSATYPSLQELKKEGESGRRKLNQYTRYLTVALALVQGFGLAVGIESASVTVGAEVRNVVINPDLLFRIQTALTLLAGTVFLMWMGEQINSKGIGNGISILIFAGIVAELPRALYQAFEMVRIGSLESFVLIGFAVMALVVIMFIVFMESAQRRVQIQYPKRQVGMHKMAGGETSHMPLKLNTAGVIPPIFASSLLLVPGFIANSFSGAEWAQVMAAWFAPGRPMYTALFVALIVFFCFFYTSIVFNPEETADNLKKQGGFIPGIRPGQPTADFLDKTLTRLTTVGAIYIAAVCILPEIINARYSVPFYFGGTSLLIVVSVTMDLVTRIQTHLIAQKYESLLKRTQLRGRKRQGVAS